MVEGFASIKFSKGSCKGCIVGKHAKCKYEKGKARKLVQVLDLIHSNLIGALPTPSYGNSRYVLTFIDAFSSNCSVYFLKQKSEVFEIFKVFKALVENLSGKKIKVLRMDNGKEYINNNLHQLCEENFIQMQHLVPYTPQKSCAAEHKNRALKEISTCMLEAKYFSPKIWDEEKNYVAYIHNIFPQK